MTTFLQAFMSEEIVYAALKAVIDPELGINIVDLGLIYNVCIEEEGRITITMTLTMPSCPLYTSFAQEIERELRQAIPDLTAVLVELVWDPPWDSMMVSPEGRALLGVA